MVVLLREHPDAGRTPTCWRADSTSVKTQDSHRVCSRTEQQGTRVADAAWKNASPSCLALMCKMFTLLKSFNILYTLKSYFMSYLIRSDLL